MYDTSRNHGHKKIHTLVHTVSPRTHRCAEGDWENPEKVSQILMSSEVEQQPLLDPSLSSSLNNTGKSN